MVDERYGVLEWAPEDCEKPLRVFASANQIVEVNKEYGPLAAEDVRVRLEYTDEKTDWVVERYNVETNVWEEKARWDCQESWPREQEANTGAEL